MSTYLATVTDDNHVIVTIDGIEVDRPGPWDTPKARTSGPPTSSPASKPATSTTLNSPDG